MISVGSLCTGVAGLELGLTMAGVDHQVGFVADIDPNICRWLDAHRPDASNVGDITELDELPLVDLITAGFPCQGNSTAGNRKGLDDDRWIWDDIARLVGRMDPRPDLFLENVPGLLTVNGGDALARVVSSLARLGYVGAYGTLSAADVGAPHLRKRWWCVATHASGVAFERRRGPEGMARAEGTARLEGGGSDTGRDASRGGGQAAPDPDSVGLIVGPGPRPSKPAGLRRNGSSDNRDPAAPHADSDGSDPVTDSARQGQPDTRGGVPADERDRTRAVFGEYAPAIERWERVMGRAAPHPTIDGQLSHYFDEWLQGYPEGWVTDTLDDRRPALHALGNAPVPLCAAHAYRQLAARLDTPIGVAA